MAWAPNRCEICGEVSTFTLTSLTLPARVAGVPRFEAPTPWPPPYLPPGRPPRPGGPSRVFAREVVRQRSELADTGERIRDHLLIDDPARFGSSVVCALKKFRQTITLSYEVMESSANEFTKPGGTGSLTSAGTVCELLPASGLSGTQFLPSDIGWCRPHAAEPVGVAVRLFGLNCIH
jgi:hypothetical protein